MTAIGTPKAALSLGACSWQSKPIVDTELDQVNPLSDVKRKGNIINRVRLASKIEEIVFHLNRPVSQESVLDPGTPHPSPSARADAPARNWTLNSARADCECAARVVG